MSSLYQFVVCRWNDIHPAIQRSDQINLELELVKIFSISPAGPSLITVCCTMLSLHLLTTILPASPGHKNRGVLLLFNLSEIIEKLSSFTLWSLGQV